MQILESSDLGLRAARLSLKSPRSKVRITLFPMVHIGEPEFFQAVYADAFAHDVVLVEGVNSPITRRVTRSYRWIEGARNIGLVVQPSYPEPATCHAKIFHADLSGDEFASVWCKVPFWLRAFVYVLAPIVGLQCRWFGSRESLAKGLSFEDLARREETLNWNPEFAGLTNAILNARDERLVTRLREQLDDAPAERRIAVVYGTQHMRAVLRELTSHRGYYAESAEWMTIFRLEFRV